jgi:triacylglycerol lipase
MGPPPQKYQSENPVTLVGHSAGAHTCLKLRQLLAEDHWGVGSNVHWIVAAICIAGVLNGSTLTYYFDYDPVSGLPTGNKSWLIDALVTLDTGLSEFLRNRLLVILLPQFVRDWVWQFGPHIERWIDVNRPGFAGGRFV